MSWSDVESKFTFPSVSDPKARQMTSAEQDEFLLLVRSLYEGSLSARTHIDLMVLQKTFKVVYSIDSPGFSAQGDIIGFNSTAVSQVGYFNTKGTWINETGQFAALTAIHELLHLRPLSDTIGNADIVMNDSTYDYEGGVLKIQKLVAAQMGWNDHIQSAYDAAIYSNNPNEIRSQLVFGTNYTQGNAIDYARLGDQNTIIY